MGDRESHKQVASSTAMNAKAMDKVQKDAVWLIENLGKELLSEYHDAGSYWQLIDALRQQLTEGTEQRDKVALDAGLWAARCGSAEYREDLLKARLDEKESTICGMREALLTAWIATCAPFIQIEHDEAEKCKGRDDMYGYNFHEGRASGAVNMDMDLRLILSGGMVPPTCPHKEQAERITRAEIAEQARLINERDAAKEEVELYKSEGESLRQQVGLLSDSVDSWRNECMNLRAQLAEALVTTRGEMHACDYQELLVLKAQLVAKDAVICGMREAQIKVRRQLSLSFSPEDRNKWLAFVDEVFVAHLTCPHKEEVELYKKLYEEEKEVYALSIKKENKLQAELGSLREVAKVAMDLRAVSQSGIQPEQIVTVVSPDAMRRLRKALSSHESRWGKVEKEDECQCDECQIRPHMSSCAVHNMPALPKGECDCGAVIICSGCGGAINPDYGKCQRCG